MIFDPWLHGKKNARKNLSDTLGLTEKVLLSYTYSITVLSTIEERIK